MRWLISSSTLALMTLLAGCGMARTEPTDILDPGFFTSDPGGLLTPIAGTPQLTAGKAPVDHHIGIQIIDGEGWFYNRITK